ncbi:hypothetical protein [uncultured Roseibium sp.]|uniref:hypothetical protein n=1 Tax=uncultured Roseibium sp. TaxID=1936171 RepID=UPI0032180B02
MPKLDPKTEDLVRRALNDLHRVLRDTKEGKQPDTWPPDSAIPVNPPQSAAYTILKTRKLKPAERIAILERFAVSILRNFSSLGLRYRQCCQIIAGVTGWSVRETERQMAALREVDTELASYYLQVVKRDETVN